MTATARASITRNERLQLIGLLSLAQRHNAAMKDIEAAALAITDERDGEGELNDNGHTCDALYCNLDVDALLARLKISVADPGNAEEQTR